MTGFEHDKDTNLAIRECVTAILAPLKLSMDDNVRFGADIEAAFGKMLKLAVEKETKAIRSQLRDFVRHDQTKTVSFS